MTVWGFEVANHFTSDLFAFNGRDIPGHGGTPNPGFMVLDIQGLDPVKSNLFLTENADVDGSFYSGGRVNTRNIVIKFGLLPDYSSGETIGDLRRKLGKIFHTKSKVQLKFITDENSYGYYIDGVVETHESVLFSKDSEVAVSILCPEPYFRGSDLKVFSSSNGYLNVDYGGTAPSGFISKIDIAGFGGYDSGNENFSMSTRHRVDYSENYKQDWGRIAIEYFDLQDGDIVTINHYPGQRKVVRDRGPTWSLDITGSLLNQTEWFLLLPDYSSPHYPGQTESVNGIGYSGDHTLTVEFYDKFESVY